MWFVSFCFVLFNLCEHIRSSVILDEPRCLPAHFDSQRYRHKKIVVFCFVCLVSLTYDLSACFSRGMETAFNNELNIIMCVKLRNKVEGPVEASLTVHVLAEMMKMKVVD